MRGSGPGVLLFRVFYTRGCERAGGVDTGRALLLFSGRNIFRFLCRGFRVLRARSARCVLSAVVACVGGGT